MVRKSVRLVRGPSVSTAPRGVSSPGQLETAAARQAKAAGEAGQPRPAARRTSRRASPTALPPQASSVSSPPEAAEGGRERAHTCRGGLAAGSAVRPPLGQSVGPQARAPASPPAPAPAPGAGRVLGRLPSTSAGAPGPRPATRLPRRAAGPSWAGPQAEVGLGLEDLHVSVARYPTLRHTLLCLPHTVICTLLFYYTL